MKPSRRQYKLEQEAQIKAKTCTICGFAPIVPIESWNAARCPRCGTLTELAATVPPDAPV